MIYDFFSWIGAQTVNIISSLGYPGITILMALESVCFPIPSEIIMPFSGFLASEGRFSFWPVVFWGTMGNLLGSIAAYYFGLKGGRPLIEKYGKYLLISKHELEWADNWFKKYGSLSIFFSRLLPIIRTFISLPAGISRMSFKKFCLYTFLGSLPWSFLLVYIGAIMGKSWENIEVYFRRFDWLIIIIAGFTISYWLFIKLKNK